MGKFKRAIASLSVVAILSSLVITTTASAAYSDVPTSHWFAEYVESLGELGVIDTTKDKFEPEKSINRAELVKMVTVGAGTPTSGLPATSNYSDVKTTDWFFTPVHAAEAAQIVKSAAKFEPLGTSNRAQASKVIVEAFGIEQVELDESPFSDNKVGEWYYDYVNTVYCYGIVGGFADGTYGPAKEVTKAQFGKMIALAAEGPELKAECMEGDDDDDTDDTGDDDTGDDDTGDDDTGDDDDDDVVGTGDLSVALGDTPAAKNLADGTAFNALTVLDFTAGAEAASIESLTVTKLGIISDTYIKVSVWVDGVRRGNVVTTSEGEAVVSFADPIDVAAGQTVAVTLAANIDAAANSGTVGLGIEEAADVDVSGEGEASGSFPLEGEEFGIVNGANSVASATFDIVSLGTTTTNVDPQDDYRITRFKIAETSSQEGLMLSGLTLFNNGTSADGDIQNIELKDQNGEVIATAADTENKVAMLEFPEAYEIPKGTTRYFDVFVDIVGGSTRTTQLIVQNDFDVMAAGTSTEASIILTADAASTSDTSFPIGDIATGNAGFNHITVNEGVATVTKDNSSPSGDVTLGASEQVLGTFTITAQGEDVELQQIALDLSNGVDRTAAANNTTGYLDCVTSDSPTECDLTGSIKVQTESGKTLYTVAANTTKLWNFTGAATYATLNAYHTIKAGETEKLNIIGSIGSDATNVGSGETIRAGINRVYYYKKSSLKYGNTGASSANTMSVTTSSLTVSSNSEYGAQTVVAGTSAVKIGSFVVRGSTAEEVNVTSIAVKIDNSPNSGTVITNFKLYKGDNVTGTQVGATQGTVGDDSALTLSVTGLKLGKGEEITLNGYADISSGFTDAGTLFMKVDANQVSGTGAISQASATGPSSNLSLQTITVNTSGTLTIAAADDNPVTKILVAGTAYTADDASVLKLKFSANKAENIYLKKLTLRLDTELDDASVAGAVLYGSSDPSSIGTVIGTSHTLQDDGTTRAGYISWDWSGASRPMVTSNSSYYVTAKANLVSNSQDAANTTGETPVFALEEVEAEGASAVNPTNAAVDQVVDTLLLGTFTAPTTSTDLAAALTAAATTITIGSDSATPASATANGVIDNDRGYYCYIDVDATGGYGTSDEIFYLIGEDTPAAGVGIYQIVRGMFGTTPTAITPAANNEHIFCIEAPKSNIMQLLHTKLTAAADTTGLDSSFKTEMKLAKIKFSAANNASNGAEDKATLQKVRITVTATNADATSFVMYPDDKYNDAAYAITGKYVADSVVQFDFADADANGSADTTITATVYDDIIENQNRTYTIKANTVAGTNGSLDIQLAKTGSASTAAYGASTGSDVSWSDGTTTSAWINQTGTNVNLRYVSSSSSTGTPDTTAPVISCAASCMVSQTLDGTITVADVHGFTYDEAMSQVTFTDVKMGATDGTITADFAPQAVADGALFDFVTNGAADLVITYTPSWASTTEFRLTVATAAGTVATEYEGVATPSSTMFMDTEGNAGPTGTATTAW